MRKKPENVSSVKVRPALSPEAEENQMIALATQAARKQLLEGTATSQVICHYLKLGTAKEKLEREKLEEDIKLTKAKTAAYESAKHMEELYADAIEAMRSYGGGLFDKDV